MASLFALLCSKNKGYETERFIYLWTNFNAMYSWLSELIANELGGYIEPRTFKKYYNQILALSGLPRFTFHALRHTFASRAMEQGMDAKTLSTILGHYSVSFTLDTYAHVLDDHKQAGMALMTDLYDLQSTLPIESYPIIMTTSDDGTIGLLAMGFEGVECFGENMSAGLQHLKTRSS